jgi:multidrug efflux pump subunit AcrB
MLFIRNLRAVIISSLAIPASIISSPRCASWASRSTT